MHPVDGVLVGCCFIVAERKVHFPTMEQPSLKMEEHGISQGNKFPFRMNVPFICKLVNFWEVFKLMMYTKLCEVLTYNEKF
jgi:hypothetical protein